MADEHPELTPQEAQALQGLTANAALPDALEEETVRRLRERGLLAERGGRRRAWLLAAAAALALFAAGLVVGQRRGASPTEPAGLPRYVLLLYDAPDEAALSEGQMAARVDEYRNWAGGVRRQGEFIAGEKLEPEIRRLGAEGADASARVLGGYFVIAAKDYAAAVEVARSCPHLKHGGAIEVRPIART